MISLQFPLFCKFAFLIDGIDALLRDSPSNWSGVKNLNYFNSRCFKYRRLFISC